MALIYIKKRRDPIEIANERARGLKEQWMDKNTPKDDIIDLGVWAGCIAEIQSIEMTPQRTYAPDSYFAPPTAEERKRTAKGLVSVREWLDKQSWYKEKRLDRHYTEEHRKQHCTCFRPEDYEAAAEAAP